MQHIPSQTLNTVLEEALCKVHGFGCPTSKDFLRPWVGYWKVQKKIQLLENKANSPKGNLLFALLFSSNKGLYA